MPLNGQKEPNIVTLPFWLILVPSFAQCLHGLNIAFLHAGFSNLKVTVQTVLKCVTYK